jgi:hypothetical protein
MGSIASISIDLSKLDKTKIVNGKNGQKYYNLNIGINDLSDNYGNNIQVTEPQSQEQRAAKEPRTFYGNGRVLWTDGKIEVAKKNEVTNPAPANSNASMSDNDDLPF